MSWIVPGWPSKYWTSWDDGRLMLHQLKPNINPPLESLFVRLPALYLHLLFQFSLFFYDFPLLLLIVILLLLLFLQNKSFSFQGGTIQEQRDRVLFKQSNSDEQRASFRFHTLFSSKRNRETAGKKAGTDGSETICVVSPLKRTKIREPRGQESREITEQRTRWMDSEFSGGMLSNSVAMVTLRGWSMSTNRLYSANCHSP